MKGRVWRRIAPLAGSLVLAGVVAACGGSVSSQQTRQVPRGEVLYVLDGGAGAPAHGRNIVAFSAADGADGPHLALPMGLVTQDHRRLYTVAQSGGRTSVLAYDTRTGAQVAAFSVEGGYTMEAPGSGDTGAVLSPDGRWLVLRGGGQGGGTTTFALVDTVARRLAQTISLPGTFDLDAISPHGGMLYLLQYVGDAERHYYVRAYDLTARHLLDGIIVDKTESDETTMRGTAVARQMASDGSVAYTLYVDPAQNHAFIHILPLTDDANGPLFARCVDLPSGSDANLLHFYSLALAPDGSTLYAANAALGLAGAVSLHGQQDVLDDKLERTGRFDPGAGTPSAAEASRVIFNGAALAPDQTTLYVAGLRGVWALDTASLNMPRALAAQGAFTSVALSGDGRTLYAADPTRGLVAIPLGGNGATRTVPTPARAPWGIAWVTA